MHGSYIFHSFATMTKIFNEDVAKKVAASLLEVGAVKLNPEQPFQWASGWNSPIYCDNRLTLSFPAERKYIKEQLAAIVKKDFEGADAVAGVATAGIPQGALIADFLGLPFIYVRDKAKGHGMTNRIEGKLTPGQKVVVVEDLVSTGGSSLKAVDALIEAGAEVLGMVAIFTYGFPIADDNFKNANVSLVCLSNYDALIPQAIEMGYVQSSELESLKAWRGAPSEWKK